MEARGAARRSALTLALVAPLAGCDTGPRPIAYGEETCARCLMTVADERYGAEAVTTRGRVYVFDSVECLAAWALEHDPADIRSLWVTDFHDPPTLIAVEDAVFLRSPVLRSPMGMGLTAFGDGIREEAILDAFAGELLEWEGVLALVEGEGHGHGHGGSVAPGSAPPEPSAESGGRGVDAR